MCWRGSGPLIDDSLWIVRPSMTPAIPWGCRDDDKSRNGQPLANHPLGHSPFLARLRVRTKNAGRTCVRFAARRVAAVITGVVMGNDVAHTAAHPRRRNKETQRGTG